MNHFKFIPLNWIETNHNKQSISTKRNELIQRFRTSEYEDKWFNSFISVPVLRSVKSRWSRIDLMLWGKKYTEIGGKNIVSFSLILLHLKDKISSKCKRKREIILPPANWVAATSFVQFHSHFASDSVFLNPEIFLSPKQDSVIFFSLWIFQQNVDESLKTGPVQHEHWLLHIWIGFSIKM